MRLLLIEDDTRLVRSLTAGLAEAGFAVDSAGDGPEGLQALRAHRYDACVLDVNLPSGDGFQVLRAARSEGLGTPILILTARDAVADRVHGLDHGADDYLVKPFAFAELVARLRVLLRRGTPQRAGLLRAGALTLDAAAHEVRVGGYQVELTQKQFTLLEYLLVHLDQVVTRRMLLSGVWGYSFDPGTNLVDVHVAQLRRRLESAGPGGWVCPIETLRGVGYRVRSGPAPGDPPSSGGGGAAEG